MSLIFEALQKSQREKEVAQAIEDGTANAEDLQKLAPLSTEERVASASLQRNANYRIPYPQTTSIQSTPNSNIRRVWLPLLIMGTLLCLSATFTVFAFYLMTTQHRAEKTDSIAVPTPVVHVVTLTPVPATVTVTPAPLPPTPTPAATPLPTPVPTQMPADLPVMPPPAVKSEPTQTRTPAPTNPPLPNVSLTAILASGKNGGTGMCMLNGEIHHTGQTKNGVTVLEINDDNVVIKQGENQPVTLRVR